MILPNYNESYFLCLLPDNYYTINFLSNKLTDYNILDKINAVEILQLKGIHRYPWQGVQWKI